MVIFGHVHHWVFRRFFRFWICDACGVIRGIG